MKRAIICEGKTDAILISYFLIKRFGWAYIKELVLDLPVDKRNEELNWYRHPDKPDQELVIWGAGGISEIPVKLGHVVERTRIERPPSNNRFERIVLFFDHNDRNRDECEDLVKKWTTECNGLEILGELGLGKWTEARIELDESKAPIHELLILPIALPPNSKGNLEIFLMDSIRDKSGHDKQLVDGARNFIDDLPAEPYLRKMRYRQKACLGSVLSVMSSDGAFTGLNNRLKQIQWEGIESVAAVYEKLSAL